MNNLTRLWKDFQNNWDIYIVIIGSIAVGLVAFILMPYRIVCSGNVLD